MTIWVDAHLSPRIARWISVNFPITALPLQQILGRHLSLALSLLDGGEDLVEIGSP